MYFPVFIHIFKCSTRGERDVMSSRMAVRPVTTPHHLIEPTGTQCEVDSYTGGWSFAFCPHLPSIMGSGGRPWQCGLVSQISQVPTWVKTKTLNSPLRKSLELSIIVHVPVSYSITADMDGSFHIIVHLCIWVYEWLLLPTNKVLVSHVFSDPL